MLDGELGLGPDNTVISLIRRQSTTVLRMNDRDTPASFHIGNYFAASGDGNDLTVSLQTANDGLVTFSTLAGGAANAVRFTLTPAAVTLLNNIASGDRFILAFTRPGAKPVAATFTAAAATLAVSVTKAAIETQPVGATFAGAVASMAVAVTKPAVGNQPVGVTLSASAGTLVVAVGKAAIGTQSVGASLPATAASLTVAVTKTMVGSQPAAATFTGAAASLAVNVGKAATDVQPVGATFAGASATLTIAVTKATPGTKAVGATLNAEAGALTVAVGKAAIGTQSVGVILAGAAATLTAAVTIAVVPLALTDLDTTGLDVDAKALLVASDDATAGNFFYEDEDRGGTDEPLDGEIGLGDNDTVISGIRRRTATILQFNDNNSPTALNIGAYFSTGGAGNDLTIYLQTVNDGEVSFTVASAVSFSRVDQVRFTLPSDAQTLLNNLADGDRFIFALARASVQPVAATFTGAAGSLAVAVTNAELGTSPVDVMLTAVAASLTVAVRKDTIATQPVGAMLTAAAAILTVEVEKDMAGTWRTRTNVTSPYLITGLESETEYEVQVQAVNAEGNSVWSESARATTDTGFLPLWVGDSGSYVQALELHVGDGGAWKEAEALWVGDGGAWKSVF